VYAGLVGDKVLRGAVSGLCSLGERVSGACVGYAGLVLRSLWILEGHAYFGLVSSSRLTFSDFFRALTLVQARITKVRNTRDRLNGGL
jgi:hypothetical protein